MNAKQIVALAIVVALSLGSLLAVGAMVVFGDEEPGPPAPDPDPGTVAEQTAVIVASLEADGAYNHVPAGAELTDVERAVACSDGEIGEIVLARELRSDRPADEVVESFEQVATGWRVEDRQRGEGWAGIQAVRPVGGIEGAGAALNVTATDDGLTLVEVFGSCAGQLLVREIGPPPGG